MQSLCKDCDPVCWVIRLVLLVYAAFVAANLPKNIAVLFDNIIVRLVLVLLILALATVDPAGALLLTIGFVLSIQTANKLHLSALANKAAANGPPEHFTDSSDVFEEGIDEGKHLAETVGHAAGNVVKAPVHLAEHGIDHITGHASASPHPHASASPHAATPHGAMFTSPQQLAAMQTNQIDVTNQDTEVRTWKEELGPQGLQQPAGFNFSHADMPAPFGPGPNCPIAVGAGAGPVQQ